jgi:hypothetical protein
LKEYNSNERQNKLQQLQWEEQGKRGRPHKRWRDKDEEDLNIFGVKNREAMARGRHVCKKIVLEYKAYNRQ